MSPAEILLLSALGVVVTFVWIALIRASVRRGCRSGSCQIGMPNQEEKKDD